MTEQVAVTGVGAVTCLGLSARATWEGLIAGRSGIQTLTRFPTVGLKTTIGGPVELPVPDGRIWTRTKLMAERALAEAIDQAGLSADGPFDAPLFVGMTGYEFTWNDRHEQARAAAARGTSFLAEYRHEGNSGDFVRDASILTVLQERFGISGPAAGVTTACASGSSAIEFATRAIRRGDAQVAFAGASDGSLSVEGIVRFSLLSALSQANDEPQRASRPFTKNRDGFVMSEGAAFLVLESVEHARRRGAPVLAYVRGVGSNADAFHRTRSRPDGSGGVACVAGALRDARLDADSVHYVNAHGTSTPENDRMETKILKQVFGSRAYDVPVSSNKSMLGHTLAASGAVEAVATVLTLQHGIIPPTINFDEPDDELDLDFVPNVAIERPVSIAISNSFGFGGQNVTLVLGKGDLA